MISEASNLVLRLIGRSWAAYNVSCAISALKRNTGVLELTVELESIIERCGESVAQQLADMLRTNKTIRRLCCSKPSHAHDLEMIISAVPKSEIRDLALNIYADSLDANDTDTHRFTESLGLCTKLEYLSLKFVGNVERSAFHHLMVDVFPKLTSLKSLDIALCNEHGSGSCIKSLREGIQRHSGIELLDVHTTASLVPLEPVIRSLKHFGCRWNERRQNKLIALLGSCTQLETMRVYFPPATSMQMLVAVCCLLSRLPRLEEVQYHASSQAALDKSIADVLVSMMESSTTIQTIGLNPILQNLLSQSTEASGKLSFYSRRSRRNNQLRCAQTDKLLAGNTPVSVWPHALAKLSSKGWTDVMFHLVREKIDVLVKS